MKRESEIERTEKKRELRKGWMEKRRWVMGGG